MGLPLDALDRAVRQVLATNGGAGMNEDRHDRMKRQLPGRQGPLDEGAQRRLDGELAHAAVLLYYLVPVLMLISLVMDAYTHQRVTVSFGTVALLIVHVFLSSKVIRASKKAGVSGPESLPSSERAQTPGKMKRSAWLAGLGWGASMALTMNVVLPWVAGQPVKQDLFHWLIWLVGGVAIGGYVYWENRRHGKAL